MARYAHIYWSTEELDAQVKQMAAADMDSVSKFISRLAIKEYERRQQARQLVDSRVEYATTEEAR
jgi:hypothetical protein